MIHHKLMKFNQFNQTHFGISWSVMIGFPMLSQQQYPYDEKNKPKKSSAQTGSSAFFIAAPLEDHQSHKVVPQFGIAKLGFT